MPNSDYTDRGVNHGFCPYGEISTAIAVGAAPVTVNVTNLNSSVANPIVVGRAAMINEEILAITAVTGLSVTLARGCCDTVPQAHAAGSTIWFVDDSIGRDTVEYAPTETVSVKPRVRTSTAVVSMENAPPIQVTMNSRFARPYPPGNLQVNGQAWFNAQVLEEADTEITFTWANRNRVTQADTLVSHDQGNVTPEVGQTTRIRFYRTSDDTLVRTEAGLTGTSFVYDADEARTDFGVVGADVDAYAIVDSQRAGLDSWRSYRIDFTIEPQGAGATDPFFSNVVLLLHCDGPNGSTSFPDNSPVTTSVVTRGTAQVSDATPVFGTGSLLLDGSTDCCLDFPTSSDFNFGAGDFTVELACIRTGAATNEFVRLFSTNSGDGFAGLKIGVNVSAIGGQDQLWAALSTTGTSWTVLTTSVSIGSLVPGQLNHVAVSRSGSVVRVFLNGALVFSQSISGALYWDIANVVTIGGQTSGLNRNFIGRIDEVRVTNGVARYTANFTPPTAPFPDS